MATLFLDSRSIIASGQCHDKRFLITVPIMHRQHLQSANQNGGATSTKKACNRYGSNLGFERARSRGFEHKAVSTVRSPRQRVTFFKIGSSFGRNKSFRSITCKQAFEGLKEVLAGQNNLHHKPPTFLMGEQIKHLVSSSSFEMSIY